MLGKKKAKKEAVIEVSEAPVVLERTGKVSESHEMDKPESPLVVNKRMRENKLPNLND